MTFRSTAEEMERLQLSDEDTEDLWNSPSKQRADQPFHPRKSERSPVSESRQSHDGGDTMFDRQEAREAALQNELRTVRKINEVIEGLLSSIDCAKGNMEVSSHSLHKKSYKFPDPPLFFRLFQKQSHPHRPSSTPGPEFFPRPNTISV